jgi:ribosomal protein S25
MAETQMGEKSSDPNGPGPRRKSVVPTLTSIRVQREVSGVDLVLSNGAVVGLDLDAGRGFFETLKEVYEPEDEAQPEREERRGRRLSPEIKEAIRREIIANPSVNLTELARKYGCSQATTSGMRRKLEEKGHLKHQRD